MTYRIYDGAEYSAEAIITFHVTNTPPVAVADEYSVHQGDSITVTPLSNDSDADAEGDNLTPAITANGSNGYAYFDSAGNLYYTPYADYVGTDTVTYRIYDGAAYSAEASITFHVFLTPSEALTVYQAVVSQADATYTQALDTAISIAQWALDNHVATADYAAGLLEQTYTSAETAAYDAYTAALAAADVAYDAVVDPAEAARQARIDAAVSAYETACVDALTAPDYDVAMAAAIDAELAEFDAADAEYAALADPAQVDWDNARTAAQATYDAAEAAAWAIFEPAMNAVIAQYDADVIATLAQFDADVLAALMTWQATETAAWASMTAALLIPPSPALRILAPTWANAGTMPIPVDHLIVQPNAIQPRLNEQTRIRQLNALSQSMSIDLTALAPLAARANSLAGRLRVMSNQLLAILNRPTGTLLEFDRLFGLAIGGPATPYLIVQTQLGVSIAAVIARADEIIGNVKLPSGNGFLPTEAGYIEGTANEAIDFVNGDHLRVKGIRADLRRLNVQLQRLNEQITDTGTTGPSNESLPGIGLASLASEMIVRLTARGGVFLFRVPDLITVIGNYSIQAGKIKDVQNRIDIVLDAAFPVSVTPHATTNALNPRSDDIDNKLDSLLDDALPGPVVKVFAATREINRLSQIMLPNAPAVNAAYTAAADGATGYHATIYKAGAPDTGIEPDVMNDTAGIKGLTTSILNQVQGNPNIAIPIRSMRDLSNSAGLDRFRKKGIDSDLNILGTSLRGITNPLVDLLGRTIGAGLIAQLARAQQIRAALVVGQMANQNPAANYLGEIFVIDEDITYLTTCLTEIAILQARIASLS